MPAIVRHRTILGSDADKGLTYILQEPRDLKHCADHLLVPLTGLGLLVAVCSQEPPQLCLEVLRHAHVAVVDAFAIQPRRGGGGDSSATVVP